MGYYTKFKFSAQLSKDAPIELLDKLINGNYIEELASEKFGSVPALYTVSSFPRLPIDHEFGNTDRWESIMESASFDKDRLTIKVECDLKAYDSLYDKFSDWLSPYIITGTKKEMGEDYDIWTKSVFNQKTKTWS
jgi:hypothetical protein